MKKNLLFLCLIIFGSNFASGQSNANTTEKKKTSLITGNECFIQTKSGSAELSPYYGFDNKIKEITINNNIPEAFPTREKYNSKLNYLSAANDWIKANQNFIRPEFKNTTLKD